ncbi:tetrahydromethanopterin S-methyltransferase subunit F [Methanocaldococcus indicus]|uniref:tetrahydromethanopterin S-methyltransferase subunit F n=1 Tax=Methanocaldococcus indicus TaxID=213231 RepID=UPI003C6D00F0
MSIEISNKPNIKSIQEYLEDLEYKVGLITRNRGLESGVESAGIRGIACGAVFGIVMMTIALALYYLLR